jgi:hypothetical protein
MGITAREKENQQAGLRWQTTRSLNPNNKLHSVNETILETAMTRQKSFSGGVKMQLCKKCRQFVSPAIFFDRLKHDMCNGAFPTSFSHSEYNYNKNNDKDGYVEMGKYKCLQNFGREGSEDDKTLRV